MPRFILSKDKTIDTVSSVLKIKQNYNTNM